MFRGVARTVSESGLSIRTQKPFKAGAVANITIRLPEERTCNLTAIVRCARKRLFLRYLNGMGLEIIKNDLGYLAFVKSIKKR